MSGDGNRYKEMSTGDVEEKNIRGKFDHRINCAGNIPSQENDCTCGLKWRIMLKTEQEMHNAWRKRAEEAEETLSKIKPAAQNLLAQWIAYQATAGNYEEAYYKLAKYAYPHWLELQKAIGSPNG